MEEEHQPEEIHLTIVGTPAPQGSKVAFSRKGSSKVTMLEQTRKTLDPWRKAVTLQARRQYRRPAPLGVPVSLSLVFAFERPKTVRRPYPSVARGAGDLDKLTRAVKDALKAAGVYDDDALVTRHHEPFGKVYVGGPYWEGCPEMSQPGVLISIRPLAAVALPGSCRFPAGSARSEGRR
jgi:Holliday junction resolvase RusA-like endonuclease